MKLNYGTENISQMLSGIPHCDTAEILVPLNSTIRRHYFPDIVKLRYAPIIGCEFIQGTGAGNNSPSGNVLSVQGQVNNLYLTLARLNGYEVISGLQCTRLVRGNTDGRIFPLDIHDVDWQKSYVEFTGAAADWTAAQTSIFFIFYHLGQKQPQGVAGH